MIVAMVMQAVRTDETPVYFQLRDYMAPTLLKAVTLMDVVCYTE
jgi:hypothetical protein